MQLQTMRPAIGEGRSKVAGTSLLERADWVEAILFDFELSSSSCNIVRSKSVM